MKQIYKWFICSIVFFCSGFSLLAQDAIPETIVIFGVDCSLSKIVTTNKYNPETLIKNDIPRLNREMAVICNQFKEKFWAKEMLIDTTDVSLRNAQLSPYTFITDTRFQFQNGDAIVREHVKTHLPSGYENKSGAGLLFVMEKIDERKDRESFYIVLFELQSGKIIHCDKVETGLSSIKNAIGSGWFSWKTGILRTIAAMDDVYEFWKLYPEQEKIDITLKKEKVQLNDSIHPIRIIPDTVKGIKNAKLLMLDMSITTFVEEMEEDYKNQLTEKYGEGSTYGVNNTSFVPQFNVSFDYGLTKKQTIGVSLGIDKCTVTWGTHSGVKEYKDIWNRYQAALRWNFYFVRVPVYHLYAGAQLTYNAYSKTLTPDPDQFSKQLVPFSVGLQLHLGMAFFIKQKTGINIRGGIGILSDYLTVGISRRF